MLRRSIFTIVFILVCLSGLTTHAVEAQVDDQSSHYTANMQTGIDPYSAVLGAHETVSLNSGNVHIEVPLVHFPGINGLDLNLSVYYDSKNWDLAIGDNFFEGPPPQAGGGGTYQVAWANSYNPSGAFAGGALSIPILAYTSGQIGVAQEDAGAAGVTYDIISGNSGFVYIDEHGGKHSFTIMRDLTGFIESPTSGAWTPIWIDESNDGSYLRIDTTNFPDVKVYRKDGSIVDFNVHSNGATLQQLITGEFPGPNGTQSANYPLSITDTNGNHITFAPGTDPSGNSAFQITDTVGRSVFISNAITYKNSLGSIVSITAASQTPSVTSSAIVLSTVGGCSVAGRTTDINPTATYVSTVKQYLITESSGNVSRSTSIALDSVGEPIWLQTPEGGNTTYTYAAFQTPYFTPGGAVSCSEHDNRQIVQKSVCPAATGSCSSPDVTTYAPVQTSQYGNDQNTVTFPADQNGVRNYEIHSYSFVTSNNTSFETSVATYSGSGALLQTVATTYEVASLNFALPTKVVTTRNDVSPSLSSMVETDYDSVQPVCVASSGTTCGQQIGSGTFLIDDPIERRSYDFNSNLISKEDFTYYKPGTSSLYADNGGHLFNAVLTKAFTDAITGNISSFQIQRNAEGDATSTTRSATNLPAVTVSTPVDAFGRIESSQDWDLHPTTYGYASGWADSACAVSTSGPDQPSQITDALGHEVTKTYYSCTGQLATVEDANRKTTSYTYDPLGRPFQVIHPDTGVITYSYVDTPPNTVTTSVTMSASTSISTTMTEDGLGRKSVQTLNSDPAGSVSTEFFYDGPGRMYETTNPHRAQPSTTDGFTTYTFDALNRPLIETEADGSATKWAYTGAQTTFTDESLNSWTRTVDALERLVSVTEPGARVTNYTYNGFSDLTSVAQLGVSGETPRTRSFTYDSLSRLLTATNPENGSVSYSYDANGNVLTKTDARGVATSYGYDALNRLVSKAYSGVTGSVAATPSSTFIYDSSTNGVAVLNSIGRLVEEYTGSSTAPNTERSILGYDAMGRITQEQQCGVLSVCGAAPYNFQYMYDLAGNMISSTNGVSSTGIGLTYAYDGAERLQTVTSTWDDATHPATLFSPPASGAQYSPVGLSEASLGTFSASQPPVYTLQRAYDNRLRPVSETDVATVSVLNPATVSTGSIAIAGAEQQTNGAGTPATGSVTITGTEGSHQVCTTGPVPLPTPGEPLPTPITRCVNVFDTGTLSVTVDGFTATASYKALSTDATITTALATALSVSGSPVTATASSNVLTMTSIATGTAADYPFSVSNGTDFDGTDSGAALTGGVSGPVIYDAGSVSVTVNGTTTTVPWQEGSTAQSVATNLASALQSADGSLLTASLSGTTVLLVSKQTGTAADMTITTSVAYNSTSFNSASFSVVASGMTGGVNAVNGPTTIYSYSIPAGGYAPNSNLMTLNDSVIGGWAYTYDGLNRLIAAQASANAQTGFAPYNNALLNWTYDSFGNDKGETLSGGTALSLPQVSHTYTGDSLLNGIARKGVITNQMDGYNYDASGNLLSDNISSSYSYDAEGRVASVDGTTQYVYDAEGRRVAKLNGTTPTNLYLLGLGGEQVSEINNSTGTMAWAHSNVYAAGKLLATYNPSGLHYQFSDWLGTRRVQSLVQASGAEMVEETCQSLPYGDALTCSGTDATEQHFTGKERDAESGLDYFPARYLGSSMGRWMSPDPLPWLGWQHPSEDASEEEQEEAHKKFEDWISNPQNLNLYAYVNNNPLSHTDPTGMAGCQAGDKKFTTCTITVTYDPKTSKGTLVVTGQNKGDKSPTTLLTSSVVVGGDGHVTPTGTFTAQSWEKDHVSTKYGTWADTPYSKTAIGLNAFGPYQLHIKELDSRGIYIHGTMGPNGFPFTWGNSVLGDSSHGCIRMCNRDDNALHTLMPSPAGNKIIIKTGPQ